MLPEYNLEGKVAIVTGGGRGIGKGVALALAEAGADITVSARTSAEINQTAEEVRQLGRKALAIPADVTKAEQVQRMVDMTIDEFGKIDILVNNAAAIGGVKPLVPLPHIKLPPDAQPHDFYEPMGEEEWRDNFEVDLHGAFLCIRAVGPYMIKQRSGKIINITSSHSVAGFDYNTPYCLTKAAKARFTQTLAREWARYNINVNAIGPGLVRTEMTDKYIFAREDLLQKYIRATPLGRLGTPRDIGLLAVYLASDASNWMTGQSIYLCGGITVP